ncbi:hypothetical protein LEM8419_01954 [Neolewinella maritima]|uniref:DUF2167 domain-containing protein n=1 Tax=Neolewinella maritima TaxID=1383882 RepID=A0ABN8F4T2_9BACT|nr:DUF2167 domain-containing protein [Neolewinella maritima]CAH1000926.1 hypothetical protein LEM8419_01954 [Neolewinella maritima]
MQVNVLTVALLLLSGYAQAQLLDTEAYDEAEVVDPYQEWADSVAQTLTFYADTTLTIGDGLADLAIPPGYTFVYPDDAYTVLVDLWGNMPEMGDASLGMLFPAQYGPANPAGYGINISYTEEGYVSDDDAADYDYDELLEQLQEDTEAGNAYREEQGYQAMHLLGWAATPHYDQTNKRLHWAKRLQFEGMPVETLNYNILFLGRRGYLTFNVIGGMQDLPEVDAKLDDMLASLTYTTGNRYADFDASTDNIAAYGIAALIGAKVLAKTGLLATIGIFLLKAWKLIAIAVVAAGAGLKKFLGR